MSTSKCCGRNLYIPMDDVVKIGHSTNMQFGGNYWNINEKYTKAISKILFYQLEAMTVVLTGT